MSGIHKYSKLLSDGTRRWYYKVSREKGAPVFWQVDGKPEPEPFCEAFQTAYNKQKGIWQSSAPGRPTPGTMAAIIPEFEDDLRARGKSQKTIDEYQASFEAIRAKYGSAAPAAFTVRQMRKQVKDWHRGFADTPRTADYHLSTLVTLLNFAVDEGEIANHVCHKIKRLYHPDRSEIIWLPDELEPILAVMHKRAGWAVRLARLAGYRRGDLVNIPVTADKGNELVWSSSKSGEQTDYCTPIYDELRALLDEIAAERATLDAKPTTILFNNRGKPWTADGVSTVFMRARDRVYGRGFEKRFGDLRGTAATRYALAGFSIEEIAEFMAWNEDTVRHIITRYVGRKALVQRRILQLNANGKG